jgi:hypothetical protein
MGLVQMHLRVVEWSAFTPSRLITRASSLTLSLRPPPSTGEGRSCGRRAPHLLQKLVR